MEIELLPLGQSLSGKIRATALRWKGKPPGMPPEMTEEFKTLVVAGKTIRDLTNSRSGGDPPMVSFDQFEKHCQLNPEWGKEVRKLSIDWSAD